MRELARTAHAHAHAHRETQSPARRPARKLGSGTGSLAALALRGDGREAGLRPELLGFWGRLGATEGMIY